jgi:hypothetical protein
VEDSAVTGTVFAVVSVHGTWYWSSKSSNTGVQVPGSVKTDLSYGHGSF